MGLYHCICLLLWDYNIAVACCYGIIPLQCTAVMGLCHFSCLLLWDYTIAIACYNGKAILMMDLEDGLSVGNGTIKIQEWWCKCHFYNPFPAIGLCGLVH